MEILNIIINIIKYYYSSGNVYDQYITSSCAHKSCTGD